MVLWEISKNNPVWIGGKSLFAIYWLIHIMCIIPYTMQNNLWNNLCEGCPGEDPASLLTLITPEQRAHVENYLRNLEDFDFDEAGASRPFLILAYSIYWDDIHPDIIDKTMWALIYAYKSGNKLRPTSCELGENIESTSCLMRQRVTKVLDFMRERWEIPTALERSITTQQEREKHFRSRMHRGITLLERIMNR